MEEITKLVHYDFKMRKWEEVHHIYCPMCRVKITKLNDHVLEIGLTIKCPGCNFLFSILPQ